MGWGVRLINSERISSNKRRIATVLSSLRTIRNVLVRESVPTKEGLRHFLFFPTHLACRVRESVPTKEGLRPLAELKLCGFLALGERISSNKRRIATFCFWSLAISPLRVRESVPTKEGLRQYIYSPIYLLFTVRESVPTKEGLRQRG